MGWAHRLMAGGYVPEPDRQLCWWLEVVSWRGMDEDVYRSQSLIALLSAAVGELADSSELFWLSTGGCMYCCGSGR